MFSIQLTQGQTAIVDDQDADLAALSWHATRKTTGAFYARRNVRSDIGRTTQYLHQLIAERMGISGLADHRDRNSLDCRRLNLRPATFGQNMANRSFATGSGFKGVGWRASHKHWRARIAVDRQQQHLGYFDDPIDAAKAYDRAATKLHGAFAVLNFPTQ